MCVTTISQSFVARLVCAGILLANVVAFAGHADAAQQKGADPLAVNLILTADSPDVARVGDFRVINGYLSRSPRVFRSTSDKAHVLYTPKLSLHGSYEVYAWWPQVASGAGKVDAIIKDASGPTRLVIDQGSKGGQWNLLGVYESASGKPIIVSMKAAPGQPVIADAVRFNRTGRKLPQLEIEPQRLPPGEVNTDYRVELSANGRPPFVWALGAGQTPDGIVLDSATGILSGRAADTGRSQFTIEVRDATGRHAQREMKLEMLESEVSR